ncbi:hypothetical protein EON82_02865 [bacterium]|nr:MAG: hypothetical protein EON82_02865 [bacterium]
MKRKDLNKIISIQTGFHMATRSAGLGLILASMATMAQGQSEPIVTKPPIASEELVDGFEGTSGLAQVTGQNAKVNVTAAGATSGTQAIGATFLPAAAGAYSTVRVNAKTPWSLSGKAGIAIDITNPSSETIQFGLGLFDTAGVNSGNYTSVGPNETKTFFLSFQSDANPADYGMAGLPSPYAGYRVVRVPASALNMSQVARLHIYMRWPSESKDLYLDNLRVVGAVNTRDLLTGMVDAYGQYAKDIWPNKITAQSQLADRNTLEKADLQSHPRPSAFDIYGADAAGPKGAASGYFRTEKIDGKWWFIAPNGNRFFSTGMDGLRRGATLTDITRREYMFANLPATSTNLAEFYSTSGTTTSFNFYGANLKRKYGNGYDSAWQTRTLDRLASWGMNTIGRGSDTSFIGNGRLPYVASFKVDGAFNHVVVDSSVNSPLADPFDSKWLAELTTDVKRWAGYVKRDPRCLGYLVDVEPIWCTYDPKIGDIALAYAVMKQNSTSSPAKLALTNMMVAKYGTIFGLNAAWGTKYTNWAGFGGAATPTSTPNTKMVADMRAFVRSFADKYFSAVDKAIATYAPGYLYLGCSLNRQTPEVVAAAAKYCDVISTNIYDESPNGDRLNALAATGKPVYITEFHFGATDRGGFHPGLVAASSQADRAAKYKRYMADALAHPNVIGANWFTYVDQPITSATGSKENYAVGFVDVSDTAYSDIVTASRSFGASMYAASKLN